MPDGAGMRLHPRPPHARIVQRRPQGHRGIVRPDGTRHMHLGPGPRGGGGLVAALAAKGGPHAVSRQGLVDPGQALARQR
jgi:1-acyl-sn-glycerol-3-phosphate acyltransferase